ncbi:hypothetical protein [Streptomyces specialis]|nr:hypothetical protein [Streptomyces specialis]
MTALAQDFHTSESTVRRWLTQAGAQLRDHAASRAALRARNKQRHP